ncbi:MAG: ATP-binding protein [Paludibacteraceae bacterium]|jgi:Signal transduction histidine kinase|nr:ATP-binding protein [Paludibacteraceae bacterium]
MKTSFDNLKKIKYIFSSIALLIVGVSMYYTHLLTKEMAEEERQRISLWAEATQRLVTDTDGSDLVFLMKVIEGNTNIPVLIVDEGGNVTDYRNIDVPEENGDEYIQKMVKKFQRLNKPIEITIDEETKHKLYYGNSTMLNKLEYYPYIQWGIILAFFAIIFFVFASAKRSEQNRVWVGLSKETAHQLGTPISSLLAWVEILKEEKVNPDLMTEMEKDVNRLRTIAERFSKIGSIPELTPTSLDTLLQNSLSYMRKRTSDKVQITYHFKDEMPITLALNQPLFEWVIENLCKNAIDAMEGEGHINVEVAQEKEKVIIDVSDTGKGIPKSKFDAVFSPGFTTKKRGWGLGLSLVKRIIEEYHKGKIFVKHSEIDKGTTFRIILSKQIKN